MYVCMYVCMYGVLKEVVNSRQDFQEEPEPGFKRLAPGRQADWLSGFLCTSLENGRIGVVRCLQVDQEVSLHHSHIPADSSNPGVVCRKAKMSKGSKESLP